MRHRNHLEKQANRVLCVPRRSPLHAMGKKQRNTGTELKKRPSAGTGAGIELPGLSSHDSWRSDPTAYGRMRINLDSLALFKRRDVATKLDEVYSHYPRQGSLTAYRVSHGEGASGVGSFLDVDWDAPIKRRVAFTRVLRWFPWARGLKPQGVHVDAAGQKKKKDLSRERHSVSGACFFYFFSTPRVGASYY